MKKLFRQSTGTVFILFLLILPRVTISEEKEFGGHAKLLVGGLDLLNDSRYADLTSTEVRLFGKLSAEHLHFEIHPQLTAISSSQLEKTPFQNLPDNSFQFLDLSGEFVDEKDVHGSMSLDRLSQRIDFEETEIEFGRVPLSLGNGLTFQTLDIGSFAPTALDREYKAGTDSIRVREVLSFADVEAFYVPRRDPATREYEDSLSSQILRIKKEGVFDNVDFQLTSGRHLDNPFVGGGFNRSLLDGMARGDLIWFENHNHSRIGTILNYDRTFFLFERNVYGFVEYFHSPFGSNEDGYISPKLGRDVRLLTGELYTLGKNYLSTGGDIETTPLTKIGASTFINLQDGSFLLQPMFKYNFLQDAELLCGAIFRFGDEQSEFGGGSLSLTPKAHQLYARVAIYF